MLMRCNERPDKSSKDTKKLKARTASHSQPCSRSDDNKLEVDRRSHHHRLSSSSPPKRKEEEKKKLKQLECNSATPLLTSTAMANILMASSNTKTLPPSLAPPLTKPPKTQNTPFAIRCQLHGQNLPKLVARLCKPAASAGAVAAVLLAAAPSMASEIEKAALFDFNLTLPAIALEFLLLMVALDKIYFTPLGKFMDERDAAIRASLADVKDTSEEVKQLEEQAAAVMKAARAEISSALNQMKKETTAELEKKLAEGRRKVEAELQEALQSLEKQKEDTIKALDSQIAALSDEIVKKVLPTT